MKALLAMLSVMVLAGTASADVKCYARSLSNAPQEGLVEIATAPGLGKKPVALSTLISFEGFGMPILPEEINAYGDVIPEATMGLCNEGAYIVISQNLGQEATLKLVCKNDSAPTQVFEASVGANSEIVCQ